MVEDDLPQATVLIEFKSLTVAPPRAKPQHFQGNGATTNFKRFRKVKVKVVKCLKIADLQAHDAL